MNRHKVLDSIYVAIDVLNHLVVSYLMGETATDKSKTYLSVDNRWSMDLCFVNKGYKVDKTLS